MKAMICFFVLDCGSEDRYEPFAAMVRCAKTLIGIDHISSNDGFGDFYKIDPQASATCEVLCQIFEEDKISKNVPSAYTQESCMIPECLSIQIQHVKRWNMRECYWRRVFQLQKIIDETFLSEDICTKSVVRESIIKKVNFMQMDRLLFRIFQNKILKSFMHQHPTVMGSLISCELQKGVEAAIFLYPIENGYKVSMRSNEKVKVSEIAKTHGGGGHIRAAGCSMKGTLKDIQSTIISEITEQL